MSSVFKLGYNKVDRRMVLPGLVAALSFPVPAGTFVKRIYAQNRSLTAVNLTVGNAAAGAQYLASVAVPIAANVQVPDERKTATPGSTVTVRRAGVLTPKPAIDVAVSKVNSVVHVTLSAYPAVGAGADARGLVDVVVEFEELWDSLPLPNSVNVHGY